MMIWFLFLSLLSGVLELGSVWYAWNTGFSTTGILLFALLYQTGNLLCIPRLVTRRSIAALGIAGLLLSAGNLFLNSLVLLGVEIVIASLCIQAARSKHKSQCPAWLKRTFRIAGFLLAPVFIVSPRLSAALCLSAATAAALSGRQDMPHQVNDVQKPTSLSLVMLFHQMHYFTYTYIMPLSIASLTGSIMAGAISFALTWVVYLLPQTLAEYCGNTAWRRMFFIGHGFLALVMAGLGAAFSLGNTIAVMVFWMLTGLGGGTVFCIKHLTRRYETMDMTFSENLGHTLGPLTAILAINVLTGQETVILPAISCAFVCLTLIFATLIVRREKSHE